MENDQLRLAIYSGAGLPEGWVRRQWRGDPMPNAERHWPPADPEKPPHVQRYCTATLYPDGRWHLLVEDGPRQYTKHPPGWEVSSKRVAEALHAAEAAAAIFMADPVSYPREPDWARIFGRS